MSKNSTRRDTIRFIGISSCFILVLFSVMVLSPWSYQFDGAASLSTSDVFRGDGDVFGESVDPELELAEISSSIESLSSALPSYSYFDRFYSKEKREEFKEARAEIYELQWKRIILLQETKQTETLKEVLKDYVKVIGHHQADAEHILNSQSTKD